MSNGGSYDPHAVEGEIYRFWEAGGYFHARPNPDRRPYVIDIPLPNVTGALHLGHAINNTLQDILIRRARMQGYETLWMPGTDHAGIATQAVVEKKLKEEQNLTRHELGRDGLVAKIWEWKEEYGGRILGQLRKMGFSLDWPRTRFTLDEVCARAVYEVFFRWFKDGLIYRGTRLVNWDAALQTAVSDDEIVHETVKGHLWHYRYPIEGRNATAEDAELGRDYLVIATTRPETMLGDTALAVHPDDERYRHLIGKNCTLPLVNRPIPIIGDDILVKQEFGTGCVKVTPGHDPNDYECGKRHGLEEINILTVDGKINERGGAYAGLDRYEARKKVVADLEALGLMEKIEDYETEIGHSDRSKTPIEPMLSEQWFLKMGDLAELAMEAVRDGRVQFFPERYAKTFLDWLGEKRDWCISRQLWWGHRIPVWHAMMAAHEPDRKAQGVRFADWPRVLREQLRQALDDYARAAGCEGEFVLTDVGSEDSRCYVCARTLQAQKILAEFESRKHRAEFVKLFEADPPPVKELSPSDPRYEIERRLNELLLRFKQDPDVLDTWFSSALWPFSTLGWPDNYGRGDQESERSRDQEQAADPNSISRSLDLSISDFDYFYPTSVLVTAREIITLWVARMVVSGLYFVGRVPFSHVYIHPNIQDGQGRRMSKSTGNGVDPLDIIEFYGTDALRYTMATIATETQDARLPVSYHCPHCGALTAQASVVPHNKYPREITEVTCKECKKPFATVWAKKEVKEKLGVGLDTSDRFEPARNLCNKIWQAATGFVMSNLHEYDPRPLMPEDLAVEDRWILSRLAGTVAEIDRRFERYQVSDIAERLRAFFWGDYCDWYVELVKPRLFAKDESGEVQPESGPSSAVARQVLVYVLDQTLRLLHPFIPFVTEALWKKLAEVAPRRGLTEIRDAEPALIIAAWPSAENIPHDPEVEREMTATQDIIRALRDTLARINTSRSAAKSPAIGKLPHAVIRAADDALAEGLQEQAEVLRRLGRCVAVEIGTAVEKPEEAATQVLTGVEVYVPLGGLMDLGAERKRLQNERDKLRDHIERLTGKLSNESFVAKAPAAVVEQERERLAEMKSRLVTIEKNLADIGTT